MKYVYIGINFLERFNNGKFLFYAIEIIAFILRLRKVKFKDVEKLIENQEQNMTNKVNIEFLKEQVQKLQDDVEKLIRNGSGH